MWHSFIIMSILTSIGGCLVLDGTAAENSNICDPSIFVGCAQLLANAKGDILADDTFLDTLRDSRITYAAIERRMEEASATADRLEETRRLYKLLSHRGTLLYLVLQALSHLNPFYQWSLEGFKFQLQSTLQSCQDKSENRGQSLQELFTWEVYCSTCRGLFESHKLVLAFMIAKALDTEAGNVPRKMLEFLLRGITEESEGHACPPQVRFGMLRYHVRLPHCKTLL